MIERLAADSRRCAPGVAFFAWPGESSDGRRHIAQALERGCAAVLWESEGFTWESGWRVAGKTGTAHKQEKGGYAAHKYVSSFVGFAPASDPRLVIAVMIDEPGAGQHYGGAVAAPVFAQIMQGALRLMNVPQDAPLEPLGLPGEIEAAKEST